MTLQRLRGAIPQGSIILASTTLGSYLLGLVRDRMFARTFGASTALDAYNAAFLLPDFLFNMFVASGIAAAFVPIFTDLLRADRRRAQQYVNTVLTAAVGVMMVAAVLLLLFGNAASALVAPGFDAGERVLVAKLLRILVFSSLLFAASNALGAALVVKRRFLFYGLSPMLYNLGIIGGTLLLEPHFGITGVALGTVAGAGLHLSARVFDIRRAGLVLRARFTFRLPEFRKTIRLMLPKMLGQPVELATFWAFTAIASTLSVGSIAVLNFARNFQSVPVSLIGIAVATAIFPVLAQAQSEGSQEKFRAALKRTFWLILAASTGAALVTLLIREPLVSIVLGGRAFTDADIIRTATMLGVFTLAMPTEALVHLLSRAYYATKNTTIPVVLSILGFAIAILSARALTPSLDILALPLGFFFGSATRLLLLMAILPLRLRRLENTRG